MPLRHLDENPRLLEPPDQPDEDIAPIVDECGPFLLEMVADALKRATDAEHQRSERKADHRRAHGDAGGDEGDADAMTLAVPDVLVSLLVRMHETSPFRVESNHLVFLFRTG